MRLRTAKRLSLEGIPEEQQQLASEIASIINVFNEDVATVINGNLGFDNLNRKIIQIPMQTDASGNVQPFEVKTGISGNPVGCNIVNLYMTNTPAQVPNITSAPFICFTPIGNGNIKITKVLNLEKNSKYTIIVEIF